MADDGGNTVTGGKVRQVVQQSRIERPADDDYPTPIEACVPMLNRVDFDGPVWECACGGGDLARAIEAAGHDVVATNLVDHGYGETGVDFLATRELRAPNIVTNPPFSHALQFIMHALDLGADCVVMLGRLQMLEGAQRYRELWSRRPPTRVMLFIQRVKFYSSAMPKADQPGWSNEAFAWFVWHRRLMGYSVEPTDAPVIEWLSLDDGRQGDLIGE